MNGQSDKGFLLTWKVCPQGVVCPCPGAIYMYKIIKNVYKIRFRNLQQMGKVIRAFCWHQHLSPRGCLPLPSGYIHKSIKIHTRTRCQVRVYRTTGPLVRIITAIFSGIRIFEPPHDKTNKMACANSEDSDQPGHPQWRFWSDWADAQADSSLFWAHLSFCWFCHEAAHLWISFLLAL